MNLLDQAKQDLSFTIEDKDSGFGRAVVFIKSDGTRYGDSNEIIAQVSDISFFIDPGNDVGVQGRIAEINVSLATLETLGIGIPKLKDGWEIIMPDSQGNLRSFTLLVVSPDRTLGIIKFQLEILDKS